MEAFAAVADADTMYLHQAMREPDWEQFLQAMQDEVQAHTEAGNWLLTLAADVPPGSTILPAVWQIKRKR